MALNYEGTFLIMKGQYICLRVKVFGHLAFQPKHGAFSIFSKLGDIAQIFSYYRNARLEFKTSSNITM